MALGSTRPLVKMSTKNIPGSKGGRCVRLTTLPPSRAECYEIWEPKPPGTLWATPGLSLDSFSFTLLRLKMIRNTNFFRLLSDNTKGCILLIFVFSLFLCIWIKRYKNSHLDILSLFLRCYLIMTRVSRNMF